MNSNLPKKTSIRRNLNLKIENFRLVTMVLILFFTFTTFSYAQENETQKSDIKVLYVGQHPNQPEGYSYGGNRKVWEEHKKWRADDFMGFLKQSFNNVTLVYGHEFVESMSANYDVTIFDAVTPIIREKEVRFDEKLGYNVLKRPADHITKEFDDASILVAGLPAVLIPNLKTKLKWACHCLEEHAFGFDKNHPLLNTPIKVVAVKEKVKTPPSFFSYYNGRDLGENMDMLRMQNTDAPEGYAPGFVSYAGFGDSPDAEVISHGPCIKTMSSVALGRHGNFFQWGYRASPKYMTDAAKDIFINTIHYMVQFKGEKPYVTRKGEPRENALDWAYKLSDKGFGHRLRFFQKIDGRINAAKARVAAGNKDLASIRYAKRSFPIPDRTLPFSHIPKELIKEFADDWNAYIQYFVENYGYLMPSSKYGSFLIDKDAQALGIANNDIKILETCVSMLLNKEKPELAQRLLIKYTNQSFEKAKDWKKWLKKNKDKLFFTETGGYKFLVSQ